jgi:hypothetical protein
MDSKPSFLEHSDIFEELEHKFFGTLEQFSGTGAQFSGTLTEL